MAANAVSRFLFNVSISLCYCCLILNVEFGFSGMLAGVLTFLMRCEATLCIRFFEIDF